MSLREVVPSRERRTLASRIGAIQRHHPHQDVTDLRRELGFFVASDAIRHVLAQFPPLNEDQRSRLCALLSAPRSGEAA